MRVAVVVAIFAAVIVVSTVGFMAFAAALPLAAFAAHIAATEAMITDDTLTTDMGMRVGSKGYTGVPFTSAIEPVGIKILAGDQEKWSEFAPAALVIVGERI